MSYDKSQNPFFWKLYFINFMLIDDASQYVYHSFPFGE